MLFELSDHCLFVIFLISKEYSLTVPPQQKYEKTHRIGHYRNVRGLRKSMVVFRLFEKLRYSNERSTIF